MLTQAATALSLVSPAGAAVGMAGSYTMLRSWGFGVVTVALAVAVTGIWNQFANLVFPIVGLALLTGVDQDHPALRTAAIVGVVIVVVAIVGFALALSSPRRARSIGDVAARMATRSLRVLRREPVTWNGESLAGFRASALGLLRRRWHVLTVATLAGHLTVFLLLLACLRAVGGHRGGGLVDRGVRRVVARPHPRSDPADPRRARDRRARPLRSPWSRSAPRTPTRSPPRCSTGR